MTEFERKFNVNPKGVAEVEKLSTTKKAEFNGGNSNVPNLEQKEDWTDTDFVADALIGMIGRHKTGEYSETLLVEESGEFNREQREDNEVPYIILFGNIKTAEDLFQIAKEVEEKYPLLHFSFDKDPEGKSIKYTARKVR